MMARRSSSVRAYSARSASRSVANRLRVAASLFSWNSSFWTAYRLTLAMRDGLLPVGLVAGLLHQPREAAELTLQELHGVGGRRADRVGALCLEPFLHVGRE